MKFTPTNIPDVILVEPQLFGDARGYFMETYQARAFAEAGIAVNFVQDNQSGSRQGTLRGLHYQVENPQAKLLRVVKGEVYDVAVDLRRSSPTFGHYSAARLSSENRCELFVPAGFAHGFYVLSEWAEIAYKASDFYNPQAERCLLWNDPTLNIPWPLTPGVETVLSAKDARGLPLAQAETFA